MARGKKKESTLTPEEKLAQALVPVEEQPYKVPENWCWTKLRYIGTVKGGKRIPKGHQFSDEPTEHPYIRVTDFRDGGIAVEGLKYVNKSTFNQIKNYTISSSDIYVSIAGSIGKVGIIPLELDGANLTENAAKITDITGSDQMYLLRFLSSEDAQQQMAESTISTTQPKLALFRIEDISLPIPPLAEQQRIVDRIEYLFAKLYEAKEKARSVLDSFETRKAAILYKAFTGELTAHWRAEHRVTLDSWTNQTIGDVIKVSSGKGLTAKNMVSDGSIPVYGGNGVTGYHNESNVGPDTVVIGRVGFYCGSVHYINEPAWVTDNALIVSYKQEINKWYLVHLLRYADLRQNDSSTAQPVVSGSKIYPIPIKTASVDEQVEIVRILDSLFAKEQQAKEAAEAVLEKIDLLKKSILARAFRGELGTNDPTEESAVELLKTVL